MTDTISKASNVHRRVAEALEDAIAAGRYALGARLPTHRALAQSFGVSIGSITRAIETLRERGLVRGEVGRGTFVMALPLKEAEGVIDLSVNAPAQVVSAEALAAASLQANERALRLAHGGYVDPAGTVEQREAVAAWLSETRTPLKADGIILCNGAQQGLHLAMAALREHAGTVLTERASFPGAIAAAGMLGLALEPVMQDGEGPLPEALDVLLARIGPAILYVVPVCQNPFGYETGPERRAALAEVVARHRAFLIEDDIYGLYAHRGGPLYRDLLPERTFYVTSFSKSLTPLIRLGVVAPPAAFLPILRRRLRAESWGLPPYAAELGVALIETGAAAVALGDLRREAAVRLALASRFLPLQPPMPQGAPHVWLPLPALRAEQVSRRASEAGLRLAPPSAMQVGEKPVEGIRVCLMAPPQRAVLERGLGLLAGLLTGDDEVVV